MSKYPITYELDITVQATDNFPEYQEEPVLVSEFFGQGSRDEQVSNYVDSRNGSEYQLKLVRPNRLSTLHKDGLIRVHPQDAKFEVYFITKPEENNGN